MLKKAQGCLKETGDAENLLKKHSVRSKLQPSVQVHDDAYLWITILVSGSFTRLPMPLLSTNINGVYTYVV